MTRSLAYNNSTLCALFRYRDAPLSGFLGSPRGCHRDQALLSGSRVRVSLYLPSDWRIDYPHKAAHIHTIVVCFSTKTQIFTYSYVLVLRVLEGDPDRILEWSTGRRAIENRRVPRTHASSPAKRRRSTPESYTYAYDSCTHRRGYMTCGSLYALYVCFCQHVLYIYISYCTSSMYCCV